MKVKLDENLPARIADVLVAAGHDVETVASEGLTGRPDGDVWQAAASEARFLITQDLDFSDTRRYKPGTHAGILVVRLHVPGANALLARVTHLANTDGLEGLAGCVATLTDTKLRVRR